ncbi:MAG: hypothetical protein E4G99_06830, partial [Anaerolineales bacterium]
MDITQITPILLILGTVLTYIGFGAFPPRIYTEKNIQERANLLAAQPRLWILTQSLVILGGITSVAGSIFLISLFRETQATLLASLAAVGFVCG